MDDDYSRKWFPIAIINQSAAALLHGVSFSSILAAAKRGIAISGRMGSTAPRPGKLRIRRRVILENVRCGRFLIDNGKSTAIGAIEHTTRGFDVIASHISARIEVGERE